MSRLSKGFRKVASTVLGKFGGDVTIRRITAGAYNPTHGTVTEGKTDVTVKGILQNVNQREVNELIKDNDKLLIVAAKDLTFTPTTSDRALVASIEYQIIRIYVDENDNENIKYEIYLRA
tara:strand:- start:244 stop:603 length:360 start_codon:yes stop_codon:yes gene_type:complete